MNKKDAVSIGALEKLFKHIDDKELDLFTGDERDALKRLVGREIGSFYIWRFIENSKSVLTYVLFFLGVYISFKAGIVEWLKSVLKS